MDFAKLFELLGRLIEGVLYSNLFFNRKRQGIYYGTSGSLSASAQGTVNITLPSSHPVVVSKIHMQTTSNKMTCQVRRSDDNNSINDTAMPVDLMFGKATGKADGLAPFYAKAGTVLSFYMTNTDSSANTADIAVFWQEA